MRIYSVWEYARFDNGVLVEKYDNKGGQLIDMCKYEDIRPLIEAVEYYASIGLRKAENALKRISE